MTPPAAVLEMLGRLGPRRLAARLARAARYRWLYPWAAPLLHPAPPPDGSLPAAGVRPGPGTRPFPSRRKAEAEARALLREGVSWLNQPPLGLDPPPDWHPPGAEPLWLYTLHYGEWALPLAAGAAAAGEARFRDALIRILGDWLVRNPPGSRPGWEPYPLSRRLVAWSEADALLGGDPAWRDFARARLRPSLRLQARMLAANLERDLDNNHLLANFKALAWVGCRHPGWPEAGRWRTIGLAGFREALHRQVPHGLHGEMSLSYHALVLQDLLEVMGLHAPAGVAVPEDLSRTAGRMATVLRTLTAPDGSWPLLNDTVEGYPCPPEDLPAVNPAAGSGEDGNDLLARSGWAVIRGGRGGHLTFDAAPMGLDHLPGHGHADTLGITLFDGGRWLVVDPGVYRYHDRPWRDHFRGTRAHSTVTVDGADQCLFLGPFRVAYPPRARLLERTPHSAAGEHDGYRRLSPPVTHRRRVAWLGEGHWEVSDTILGGGHALRASLQLAPGAAVAREGEVGWTARWEDGTSLAVEAGPLPAGARLEVEEGWHSPSWNLRVPAPRLVVRWRPAHDSSLTVGLRLLTPSRSVAPAEG